MLLLHGFLATPRVVSRLAARFRRWGYCGHAVELGGVFGRFNARPVEDLARIVAERVEQLVYDHRCERVDLVGHSEGGLIGRYYVQRLNGASRVGHLVTLGTPHRGTPWAYPGYLFRRVVPSLQQMAPGSRLLRDLGDDSFPRSVRLTSIYSQSDPLCPPSSCRLEVREGAHLKNIELPRGGHLAFLFNASISSIIRRELESWEQPNAAGARFVSAASSRPPMATPVDNRTQSAARAASAPGRVGERPCNPNLCLIEVSDGTLSANRMQTRSREETMSDRSMRGKNTGDRLARLPHREPPNEAPTAATR